MFNSLAERWLNFKMHEFVKSRISFEKMPDILPPVLSGEFEVNKFQGWGTLKEPKVAL
jgi:hypothetical protein